MEFIETFLYVIKYKQGKDNMVADMLSKRYNLSTLLNAKIIGFEHITKLYRDDHDFITIYASCLTKKVVDDYYVFHKSLIKKSMLCISRCSIKDLLLREAYGGALMGHLRINKVYKMLHKHFFWANMKHDVHKFCSQCFKRKEAKSRSPPNGLYTPLNVPNKPWTNISMKFVLGLMPTKKDKDSIFVVIDKIIKMTFFFFAKWMMQNMFLNYYLRK